jgi:hypothetical protein
VKVFSIASVIAAYVANPSGAPYTIGEATTTLQDRTGYLGETGKLDSPENVLAIGTTLYVSNFCSTGSNDYTAIDMSALPALTLRGTISNNALSGAVYAVNVGNTIYCTNRNSTDSYLTVIDATNPVSMVIQGTINLGTPLTGVDTRYYPGLQKTFAFVAGTGANQFFVVDVTDPTAPSLVATLTNAAAFNYPSNVHVVGAVAYTTAYTPDLRDPSPTSPSGITIVDISNPYAPFVISFTSTVALGLSGAQAFDHPYILGSRGYQTDTSDVGGVYVLQLGGAA